MQKKKGHTTHLNHTSPSGWRWPGGSHPARLSCSRLSGGRCWGKSCRRCRTPGQRRRRHRCCGAHRAPSAQSRTAARHRRGPGHRPHPPRPRTRRSSRICPSAARSSRPALGRGTERHRRPEGNLVFCAAHLHELRRWGEWSKLQISLRHKKRFTVNSLPLLVDSAGGTTTSGCLYPHWWSSLWYTTPQSTYT